MDKYISKDELHKIVCKNVKKYRMQVNLTQEELSEKIGISHDYLRRLESNKGKRILHFIHCTRFPLL